ncbi:DUF3300 domain-containing protein [Thalassotalea piscium]|uniref:DUF3300 domain-containing protein n=1 Tax=Thalassotalea piscium TaxID=1230533 RepID=A0A7X0TUY7_9GAMM|nr:DUF3300 domain-containing protein [Thalassotalea piscium]MBB6544575.1 hypothetical protein [Thalassotalea piscium]
MNTLLQKVNFNQLLISIMLLMLSITVYATEDQDVEFSEAELAQMLAPVALYPDSLLTHILIASTYPLEVVEAERWLAKNESLTKEQIINASEDLSWDASVKALLPFPSILQKLSEDLAWMQNLGDAFLQDEENVLATIQILRQQADEAGNLAKMDNVRVVKEKTTIIIEPAEAKVIYVPYYDTRTVYGSWRWTHFPPVYWHTSRYYSHHRGPFYWNTGVHIGFDFFFTGVHWHNRHVIVDYSSPRRYYPRKRISTSHHAKRWHHKPVHRKGVAYKSNHLKRKYSSSRPVTVSTRTRVNTNNKVTTNRTLRKEKQRVHKNVTTVEPRHKEFRQKLKERTSIKTANAEHRVKQGRPIRHAQRDTKQQIRSTDKAVTHTRNTYRSPAYSTSQTPKTVTRNEVKERKTFSKPKADMPPRQRVRQDNHKTQRVREQRRERIKE